MADGRRGAARSESARLAILEATAAQFAERGYDHLTIEGIAAVAGVGKQTIYRWWPSRSALIAECLIEGLLLPQTFVPRDSGDLRADLSAWLDGILRFAAEERGAEMFRSLLAAAAEDEGVTTRLREALSAPSELNRRLGDAIRSGELRPGTPVQELGEALVGAVVYRIVSRSPYDEGLAGRIVGAVLP